MKKRYSCLWYFVLFLFSVCQANPVSPDSAVFYAEKFFAANGFPQKKLVLHHTDISSSPPSRIQTASSPAYYIFKGTDGAGFVIVSSDDIAKPILGYSVDGKIEDGNCLPPNMQAWLDDMEQQILQARQLGLQQNVETAEQWKAPTVANAGNKLETAQWGQGYPFNQQCPMDKGKYSITGCVPTAYAILMKYYEYPVQGKGITTPYTIEDSGITVGERNLEHLYNWNMMPMEYNEGQYSQRQADAVAELMADIGAAIHAIYSSDETTATLGDDAIFPHFDFNPGMLHFKQDYTPAEWILMLKNELNQSRPVLYRGAPSTEGGGHAFILEGYNNQNYFYINWGWRGSYNGLFALDALNPGQHYYSGNQQAYFDCVPAPLLPCVAKVNDSQECPSLESAFTMALLDDSPARIKLMQNTTICYEFIGLNKEITLDLNGCAISIFHSGFFNYGHLRVIDSKGNGQIVAKTGNCAIFDNFGVLDIEGGVFSNEIAKVDSADYRRCIWSSAESTTNIKNGKFSSTNNVFTFIGDATIENGEFKTSGNIAVVFNYNTSGQVTIKDGTFTNIAPQPNGSDYRRCVWSTAGSTTVIKNGKFTTNGQTLAFNGDATIENGEYKTGGNTAVVSNYNTSGQVTIKGGAFTNTSSKTDGSDYRRCMWTAEGSKTVISGGVFTNESAAQTLCFNGNCSIWGGEFENKGSGRCCASNAKVTIYDCKIAGSNILHAWDGATLKTYGGIYSKVVGNQYLGDGSYCTQNQDAVTKQKYPYRVIGTNGIEPLYENESDMPESYYGIDGIARPNQKSGLVIIRKKNGQTIKRYYPQR